MSQKLYPRTEYRPLRFWHVRRHYRRMLQKTKNLVHFALAMLVIIAIGLTVLAATAYIK